MLFVLLLLGVYYSFTTRTEQHSVGTEAATEVFAQIASYPIDTKILILASEGQEEAEFSEFTEHLLKEANFSKVNIFRGTPFEMREALKLFEKTADRYGVIAATVKTLKLPFIEEIQDRTKIISPRSRDFPSFLKQGNLIAIADRIVVIAIIAIGMTLVVLTGGIDLSVGSLIALSAVLFTSSIRYAGGVLASSGAVWLGLFAALGACALIGLFSGVMITRFSIPPFIVTLAMMMVASGLAFILSRGQSIYEVPDSITWLGRESIAWGLPNTVWLMAVLYLLGYIMMSYTVLGRYIYATGGNREASRLSGVPVNKVLLFVYTVCAMLGGLGGIIQVSQLKSGAPTYGSTYELYVIAAVVVGGASLSGGQGKILGTLIGALIIAVIQNGMNLTGVESYTQKVVLGLVILGAVLVDKLRMGARYGK